MDILVATQKSAVWDDFIRAIQSKGHAIAMVDTLDEVKGRLRKDPPVLVVLDLNLEGKPLTDAVISLLGINASVHTAVVSSMPEDAFHACTEGLGLLMALPLLPKESEAEILLEKLSLLQAPHP